jgi:ribonuclease G
MREKLHFYEDCLVPLNVLYGLEGKLSESLSDKVWLKCGGFLYVEPTQALTVIDVNSGKYDKKSDREETYFRVNMEAAEEIATQIFVRNLTGIIVVDFINMEQKEHKDILLKAFTEFLQKDANPCRVLGFTRLGLVEITRKKTDKTIYRSALRNKTTQPLRSLPDFTDSKADIVATTYHNGVGPPSDAVALPCPT